MKTPLLPTLMMSMLVCHTPDAEAFFAPLTWLAGGTADSLTPPSISKPLKMTAEMACAVLRKNPEALYPLLKKRFPNVELSRARLYEMAAQQMRSEEAPADKSLQESLSSADKLDNPKASSSQPNLATQTLKALNIPGIVSTVSPNRPILLNLNVNEQQARLLSKTSTVIEHPDPGPVSEAESKPWYHHLYNRTRNHYEQSVVWIKEHKIRFTGYCLMGMYASTQAYLLYLAQKLSQSSCWSQWKAHCSLEELYRMPQDVLVKEVLYTLETTGHHSSNISQTMSRFIQEVGAEIDQLNRFRSIIFFIERSFLSRLFAYSTRLLEEAPFRLQRLTYLKNAVVSAVSKQGSHHYGLLFEHSTTT